MYIAGNSALVHSGELGQYEVPVVMFGGAIDGNPFQVSVRSKGGYPSKPDFLDKDNVSGSGLEKCWEKEVHPSYVNGYNLYQRNNHSDRYGGVTFRGGVERSSADWRTGAEGLGAGSLSVSIASPALHSSSDKSLVETQGVQ